eukprot:12657119-Heterocapsa_arctica.AAC.1
MAPRGHSKAATTRSPPIRRMVRSTQRKRRSIVMLSARAGLIFSAIWMLTWALMYCQLHHGVHGNDANRRM